MQIKVECSDKEFRQYKRELTHGLKGDLKRAQLLWMQALREVGAPVWARWGYYPGPREIEELRTELADRPDLLPLFERSYAIGKAEVAARFAAAGVKI
jgi:hypothetical protein